MPPLTAHEASPHLALAASLRIACQEALHLTKNDNNNNNNDSNDEIDDNNNSNNNNDRNNNNNNHDSNITGDNDSNKYKLTDTINMTKTMAVPVR